VSNFVSRCKGGVLYKLAVLERMWREQDIWAEEEESGRGQEKTTS
jgi:hypothetical protein